jgi:serine/threonine protein kinase
MLDPRLYADVTRLRSEDASLIYTARDLLAHTTVVIKAPRSLTCTQPITESQILETLSHHSIIRCRGTAHTPNGVAVVLPYYPDGDLVDLLEQRVRFSEEEVKAVLFQILNALVYLHGCRIVHRDIKPENIYRRSAKSRAVVLADFGFACRLPDGGEAEGRMGSQHYIAPEMGGRYTEKVDIWSLGATAFVLLAGRFLCDARAKNTQRAVFEEAVAKVPGELEKLGVSKRCIRLLLRMLVIDPHQRITATEALRDDWFGTGEGVEAEGSLDEPEEDE